MLDTLVLTSSQLNVSPTAVVALLWLRISCRSAGKTVGHRCVDDLKSMRGLSYDFLFLSLKALSITGL
jgi:hypothetical protein